METNKAVDVLKSIAVALLLPAIFFLLMGPMKLAEMYPEYQWLRYLPLALLLIPGLILICRNGSNE